MDLDAVLTRQAGVLSLAQATAAGLSQHAVRRRVAAGAWTRTHPRTYRVGGHRVTDESRIWAAALWVGPRGAVGGRAAASWQGLPVSATGPVDVSVPAAARLSAQPGVRLHRRDLDTADLCTVGGLRVVDAALAALQVVAVLDDGSAFLDRVLQRHVPFPQVYAAYCRNLGTRGWARVARLLVAGADRADSAAERRLLRLLRAAGIDGWVLGHRFGPYAIDLAFPDQRVAVEVDGWAWHADVHRFRSDRRKSNALTTAGWVVLRFTWHDLTERPRACVGEIRAALERSR